MILKLKLKLKFIDEKNLEIKILEYDLNFIVKDWYKIVEDGWFDVNNKVL